MGAPGALTGVSGLEENYLVPICPSQTYVELTLMSMFNIRSVWGLYLEAGDVSVTRNMLCGLSSCSYHRPLVKLVSLTPFPLKPQFPGTY